MKRLVLMLTLCFSLTSMHSFAADITVSDAALSSFNNSFSNATDVSWSTLDDYYKVSFLLHEEYITAYYDKEGQRIALTRNINVKQLPFTLQISLKKDYSSYWISELFEVNNDETGISYYVTLENADSRVVLKSGLSSEWRNFKKVSK